jgi:hypothetical protein
MHTLITQLQPSKALAQVQHSQSGGITCTASYFKLSTASDSKLHGTLPAGPASGRRCTPGPSMGRGRVALLIIQPRGWRRLQGRLARTAESGATTPRAAAGGDSNTMKLYNT